MKSSVAGLVIAIVTIAACSAGSGESSSVALPSNGAGPSPDLPSHLVAASPAASPAPSSAWTVSVAPQPAARRLLDAETADVVFEVRRERPAANAVETLLTGAGPVEPAARRGRIAYDLAGLSPPPSAVASRGPTSVVEVIWTPTNLYVAIPDVRGGAWQSRTREQGRLSGGLVGRLPDEVLGLLTVVTETGSDRTARLVGADFDGKSADRWVVSVPIEAASDAGIPADLADADAIRRTYGIEEIEVEVWLVDDSLRRIRLTFDRAASLAGGPDRTITTYDWRSPGTASPIAIPD